MGMFHRGRAGDFGTNQARRLYRQILSNLIGLLRASLLSVPTTPVHSLVLTLLQHVACIAEAYRTAHNFTHCRLATACIHAVRSAR
jgi:hypothetical protein